MSNRSKILGAKPLGAVMLMVSGLAVAPALAENGGEAAYQEACGSCHGTDAILRWADDRPDAEERQAFMDSFLQRHFRPSDDDRARIIAYMESVIAEEASVE